MIKDTDDWDYILNYTDALFYCLSNGIASRTGLSLEDAHEKTWVLFEGGYFKLKTTDSDSVGVVPCHSDDDRCAAREENGPLACYRQRVIEDAVAA
jgi:hypothetical protein